MKKNILLSLVLALPFLHLTAQVFAPIATTGYNLDAVAENTTAAATTGGAIDGSDHVIYSASYAALVSSSQGVPNNGIISTGTRTYQLQPYTQNNMLYLTGNVTDSLTFTTPAAYSGISLLGFTTEGAGTISVTVRFTDNSTQTFASISLPDWYGTGNVVISGFDRCNRTSGTPNFNTTNPKMFYTDVVISCANRTKNVRSVIIRNALTNTTRSCIMGVSGASAPVFTASSSPVTCSGGTNGSATISVSGGMPPYTYTIFSNPQQTGGFASNLSVGVYTFIAQDAANCGFTSTLAVTQSLVPQPSLNISASASTVCAGKPIVLAGSGASTYTWSNNQNGPVITFTSSSSAVYTVSGHTSANCLRTGTIAITVNPLPVVSIAATNPSLCTNSTPVTLTASPPGGTFSGGGITVATFSPAWAGVGTHVITYTYTDSNGCGSSDSTSISVFSLAPAQVVSPGALCVNASAVQLTVNPPGGIFTGPGLSSTGVLTPSTAGTGSHTYTYMISSGVCTAQSVSSFTINALPVVTFTLGKTVYCATAPDVPLNANPSTGIYSGAGVNGGFFSPSKSGVGTHVITYSYTNTNSCTTVAQLTITVNNCIGLTETSIGTVNLYPNPNDGAFTLTTGKDLSFRITDATGRLVKEITFVSEGTYNISLSGLPEGLYLITAEESGASSRIIITK